MRIPTAMAETACIITLVVGGCAAGGRQTDIHSVTSDGEANAQVHISGLACPYCVYNVERSLQNVDGVERVETDLNTGVAGVWFAPEKQPTPSSLWAAVKHSGFTPKKIVVRGETYEGE